MEEEFTPNDLRNEFRMRKRKKKLSQRKSSVILLCAILVLLIASIAIYYVITENQKAKEIAAQVAAEQEAERLQMQIDTAYQNLLNSPYFLEGITVDSVPLGGKTIEEARAALSGAVQTYAPTGTLQLTCGGESYPFDTSSIVASVNMDEILATAFQAARSGDSKTAMQEVDEIKANGRNYQLTASYDFTPVASRVSEIAALVNREAVNASVSVGSDSERSLQYTDESTGRKVLEDELIKRIMDAVLNDKTEPIEIPMEETQPTITRAELENNYTLRIQASTSFSSSTSSRKYNIRKGAGLINGTILKPGEEFSTNAVLGTRTEKNGWKVAGAYESGAVVEQAGGGVCQLSSTLYNAVVKADLEVVSRRNHSMPVSYVKKGLDATINSVGNIIDFKFKNNTDTDIIIFGYTVSNTLYFEICRTAFATDEYDEIRLTSECVVKSVSPSGEPERTFDPALTPGTETVLVAPTYGSQWQSYKNFYKNGTLIRREKLAYSTYKAFAGTVAFGPDATPSPAPTTVPTNTPPATTPAATTPPVTTPATATPTPTPTPVPATPTPTVPPTPTPTPPAATTPPSAGSTTTDSASDTPAP